MWLRTSIFLVGFILHSSVFSQLAVTEEVDFATWKQRCLATPSNRALRGAIPQRADLPIHDFREMRELTIRSLREHSTSELSTDQAWLPKQRPKDGFFDLNRSYFTKNAVPFQPFAQKLNVPPGARVIFHGDFHGDIRSFVTMLDWLNKNDYLDGFQIKRPDTFMVFLGDYVDRGSYGTEVIYTLLRLKLANPKQVWLVRGNHEDYQMTATYGFLREGQIKYGAAFDPFPIWRLYDFLPVVLYLGAGGNYIQCNHGGMEPGFNAAPLLSGEASFQLLGELQQQRFAREHPDWLDAQSSGQDQLQDFRPQTPVQPNPIGFMWNDFFVFKEEPALGYNSSRLAFNHGKHSTQFLLNLASTEKAKLRAVFRAHQHSSRPNPMMQRLIASHGVFRHWQNSDAMSLAEETNLSEAINVQYTRPIPPGSVWTFNVAPDSVYGTGNDYSFDTFGILQTAARFDHWTLNIVNQRIP